MYKRVCKLVSSRSAIQQCYKSLSTTPPANAAVTVHQHEGGYVTVEMGNKPVNSFTMDFLKELTTTFKQLENDKCRGAIIKSGLTNNVFCAGLDITEFLQPDGARLGEYWRTFQEFFITMYESNMANVALINGHAPAGGCLLASCCDYRIMVNGKTKIGLNESQIGLVAPFWFVDSMLNLMSRRDLDYMLQLGLLHSPEEALRLGMVDSVAADFAEAETMATAQMKQFLRIPDAARVISKKLLRRDLIKKFHKVRDEDVDFLVQFITPEVRAFLLKYVQSLQKKKK